jgi:hypothetical protein
MLSITLKKENKELWRVIYHDNVIFLFHLGERAENSSSVKVKQISLLCT